MAGPAPAGGVGAPAAATRASAPGWRDPRLWVGVVLVAGCVLLGARVVGGADRTVQVWATAVDLGAGDTLAPDDLVARRVRFAEEAELARYLRADEPLPADLGVLRPVGAGELLPRAALGDTSTAGVVEVPLSVAPGAVPASVVQGSVVDVYVAGVGTEPGAPARLVLDDVVVVDAPAVSEGFGSTGERQVVLAVGEDQADQLARALGAAAGGAVTITRQG
ncbi:hypothetical protein [Nocardioides perillae]|uniref:SAF domain-containing protein n=1 Tax=Nocardioides perillae TaxID=1119534 RepID=A0A7Y9RXS2_9ACTN|nr:hypothetical protein [Nocardioides perillae]NYG56672.1 hypothetical protein [Nocardioides perillae]